MGKSRLDLQADLEKIIGNRNVYFQPPESVKMNYPAIRYYKRRIENTHADNRVYLQKYFYELTLIDPTPDSEILDRLSKMPGIQHNRHYTADNLNHDVFDLYY